MCFSAVWSCYSTKSWVCHLRRFFQQVLSTQVGPVFRYCPLHKDLLTLTNTIAFNFCVCLCGEGRYTSVIIIINLKCYEYSIAWWRPTVQMFILSVLISLYIRYKPVFATVFSVQLDLKTFLNYFTEIKIVLSYQPPSLTMLCHKHCFHGHKLFWNMIFMII